MNTVAENGASHTRLAYGLMFAGALAVLVTCLGYVLAGPVASMPGGAPSFDAARAATPAAAPWMHLASGAGIVGDVVLAVAGLMLAQRRGISATGSAGWYGVAVIGLIFLVVDTMVGQVLPRLALGADMAPAYAGARTLFDGLFLVGTLAGGASALALTWVPAERPRGWGSLMRVAGVLAVLAGGAGLLGGGHSLATGGAVTLMALALAGWGWAGLR